MRFAIVVVALTMGIIYLHYLVFTALDDVIGVPLTFGVFALAYALFWLFVYREEIRFYLFPGSWARLRYRARRVPHVVPDEPVESVLMSLERIDQAAQWRRMSADPVLVETVELLKAARVGMHELLSECVGQDKPCRIVREDYGTVSARGFGGEDYLYLHEYLEVTSGYPPVHRRRVETLAHTWRFEIEQQGHADVTLTIDAKRKGRLLLKSDRRWFTADLAGWRELIDYLSRPE